MNRAELLAFMRRYPVAVEATVAAVGKPQAAVVNVAIGDDFEVVFDTLSTDRKVQNLRHDSRVALVFGGWGPGEEETVQYEGVAEEPTGRELKRIRDLYFGVFPARRPRLTGYASVIHFCVRVTWLRYSDFRQTPERVLVLSAAELEGLV